MHTESSARTHMVQEVCTLEQTRTKALKQTRPKLEAEEETRRVVICGHRQQSRERGQQIHSPRSWHDLFTADKHPHFLPNTRSFTPLHLKRNSFEVLFGKSKTLCLARRGGQGEEAEAGVIGDPFSRTRLREGGTAVANCAGCRFEARAVATELLRTRTCSGSRVARLKDHGRRSHKAQ